jgi:hypothetical protein
MSELGLPDAAIPELPDAYRWQTVSDTALADNAELASDMLQAVRCAPVLGAKAMFAAKRMRRHRARRASAGGGRPLQEMAPIFSYNSTAALLALANRPSIPLRIFPRFFEIFWRKCHGWNSDGLQHHCQEVVMSSGAYSVFIDQQAPGGGPTGALRA